MFHQLFVFEDREQYSGLKSNPSSLLAMEQHGAISITQEGKPEEKLELAFRLYDIDRNGTIEEHEMSEIIKAIYLMTNSGTGLLGDAPSERTRDIFDKMDLNSDGVLSKEEFVKGCLNDETLYKLLACSEEQNEDI